MILTKKSARKYVGGNWDTSGKKQFDFMVEEGLKPKHKLLDIGCGNFRGGRFFIDYLDKGNYYGFDHNEEIVEYGRCHELTSEQRGKEIVLLVNDDFIFDFRTQFNFALAKSVFTHLTKERIKLCLDNLRKVLKDDGVFCASIFIGNSKNNLEKDCDTKRFAYSVAEIEELANNWKIEPLGNRGCVRQTMLKLTKK